MTLEQNIGRIPATASEAFDQHLQEYRMGAAQDAKAVSSGAVKAPEKPAPSAKDDQVGHVGATVHTDLGSSANDRKIQSWKPDQGHGKHGRVWTAAARRQEKEPVAGSYYDVKNGDCLESIARRALRTQHHNVDQRSTAEGVAKLIDLNKDHYKSLSVNSDYIRQGWKLKLADGELKALDSVSAAPGAPAPDKAKADTSTMPIDGVPIKSTSDSPAPGKVESPATKTDAPATAKEHIPATPELDVPAAPGADVAPAQKAEAVAPNDGPAAPNAIAVPSKPAEAPQSVQKESTFDDKIYDFGKSFTSKAEKEICDHKWLVGGAAVVGAGLLALAGRGKIREMFSAEKEISATAEILERDAVLAKVGTIPDVVRPELTATAAKEMPKEFEKAANDYRSSLSDLKKLPSHYELGEAESVSGFAERILQHRAPITGERINPDVISKEVERLGALNPELTAATAGQRLLVHDEAALSKLAEVTQFKHVPQLGQMLKQYGVSEESIQDAFKIQNALPKENRPLIGQVLIDNGFASKEQVDKAFEQQNALKSLLREVRQAPENQ